MFVFIDLVKKSRSIRCFDHSRKISREELEALVEHVRYTPSSINLQALKFTLVYEEGEVSRVQAVTKWAGLIKDTALPPNGHWPTAFIIVSLDTAISDNERLFLKDVGIAAQTIMLAAAEKELGGCILAAFDGNAVKDMLSLPNNLKPELCLALGKPEDDVVLLDAVGGDVRYFRKDGIQYVPKRGLKEIITND